MDIGTLIARSAAKAQRERLASPAIVQRGRAIRAVSGGTADIRVAYCKTDAPAAATMQCYLDTDHTGQEVTVYFSISKGGTQLSECAPLLKDGDPIQVYRSASGEWRCCQTFDRSVESELYLP